LVDASVAVKWFIHTEVHHEEARAFLYAFGGDLEAPDIIMAEVANVLWKKQRRREINADLARSAILDTREYFEAFHFSTDFIDRALELAMELDHPVYDCIYLACADVTGAIVVTDDKKLYQIVENTAFQGLVRRLDDPDLLSPARP